MDHMGHTDMSESKHHMWMWFHVVPNDTVLFDFWVVDNAWKMVVSCIAIFILGVGLEALKYIRYRLECRSAKCQSANGTATNARSSLMSGSHAIQTVLFAIQLILSYALMLIFMTFSVWLGLAVTFGIAAGYCIFGYRPPATVPKKPEHNGLRHD